jgi:hypothetical protein
VHQIRFHSVVVAPLHQRNLAAFSPAAFDARHRFFPGSRVHRQRRGKCLSANQVSKPFISPPFPAPRERSQRSRTCLAVVVAWPRLWTGHGLFEDLPWSGTERGHKGGHCRDIARPFCVHHADTKNLLG